MISLPTPPICTPAHDRPTPRCGPESSKPYVARVASSPAASSWCRPTVVAETGAEPTLVAVKGEQTMNDVIGKNIRMWREHKA